MRAVSDMTYLLDTKPTECNLVGRSRYDGNLSLIGGFDGSLTVEQQTPPRIHRQTTGPGLTHDFDCLHPDHRHIEAHVLIRLCDLDDCQGPAEHGVTFER